MADAHQALANEIRQQTIMLRGSMDDYQPLLDTIGDVRFVLIGEASHGTHEFYKIRAELTKELIYSHGFAAVAVEGDWPDCYRVNRYVRGDHKIRNTQDALSAFQRFPTWMWRNEVVADFVYWLHGYNEGVERPRQRVGFYGLDLYSLHASIAAVVDYLDKTDPPAAARARRYYSCFDRVHAENPQGYGYAASLGLTPSCEDDVLKQLVTLQQRASDYLGKDGFEASEDYFSAEQNAKVVAGAENYYRTMFKGHVSSWNKRDLHMLKTLDALAGHLNEQRKAPAKIVVWAHNSHLGDARATEMGERGEWNLGQLMREQHGKDVFSIGFSTYSGTVTAADDWDMPGKTKTVQPGMKESYEGLFHDVGIPNFMLPLWQTEALNKHLQLSRLQRAIGVVYRPETERQSHYFFARLPAQFDALIHIDKTRALSPLKPARPSLREDVAETYPTGL
jgi:erythromycin esterase-like protein